MKNININLSRKSGNGAARSMELYPVSVESFGNNDGLSAYEIAIKNGFVGTEQEWLDSLNGTYLKMDSPNKRAFLGDVFYEDELERTYMNLGKTKVAHAINAKGQTFNINDVVPSFKELVTGINNIKLNTKLTLRTDTVLEELKKHFGDIIDFEAPVDEMHIYCKINKVAFLSNQCNNNSRMQMVSYMSSPVGFSPKSTVQVFGLNNQLVHEIKDGTDNNLYLSYSAIKGKGFVLEGDEYFRIKINFIVPADEVYEEWIKKAYHNGSYSDNEFLSYVAINGWNYSGLGGQFDFSSSYNSGHSSLRYIKVYNYKGSAHNINFSWLRSRKIINDSLDTVHIVNVIQNGNFGTSTLYDNTLNSSGSGYNINHGIRNIIFPFSLAYPKFNESGNTIINCMDYAYLLSKETIENFVNQVNYEVITKAVEIRIRYSEFLNSGSPEAEAVIAKMTEINTANPLVTFVI
ncbi:MAG: hypothetical protein ACRC92_18400 [Peptostreptococcaceae bacterium]